MFYVSAVHDGQSKSNKIGIIDTNDGIEEIWTNKDLVKVIENKVAYVYGVSVFNHIAECIPIKMNTRLSQVKLVSLLKKWKEVHNPWTEAPVEAYLASAKIGTKIIVDYYDCTPESRTKFTGRTELVRLDYDTWHYEDTCNTFSGENCDTSRATSHLEVATIYCKPTQILVLDK